MYGYLRLESAHGRGRLASQQCGLCHFYSREFRQRTRFLAGYDPSTLLLVVEALMDAPAPRAQLRCPLPPRFRRITAVDPDWRPLQLIGLLQLFLASEKLFDDRLDGDSLLSSAAESLLRRDIGQALSQLDAAGFDLEQARHVLRRQAELEQDPYADLDTLSGPTAEGLRLLATFMGEAANLEADRIDQLGAFAAQLGRCIYLVDAIDDVAEDERSGAFNPVVRAIAPWTRRSIGYLEAVFDGRIRALETHLAAMPLRAHRCTIELATVVSLETRGAAAIAQLPKPAPALLRLGAHP